MKRPNKHIDGDELRWKKKTESSTSKACKKSKHKHKYTDVLIRTPVKTVISNDYHISLGERCEICGKVNVKKCFITEKTDRGTYLILNNDAILKMYSHLEIIDREGLF